MRFKEDAQPVCSDNVWYDLTDGGYIDPEDFIDEESATEVRAAIDLVMTFVANMESHGMLEEM